MKNRLRNTVAVLILLSVVYFLLFAPPNLTGAKDPNMLATFWIDEYAQYPHVMQMTQLGNSIAETLNNLLFYGYYFYGYPFYVTSAIAILLPKFAFGWFGDNAYSTMTYMLVLRQLSPLFMLAAICLLVYMWTGFKSLWSSFLVFLFLATIPAVIDNNMWWHPDSLTTLFVVLTLFSLYKDNFEYGTWFLLAGVFCGLTTGTKMVGLWFFFTVAVYLALGLKRIQVRSLLKHAALFLAVMVLSIIASNPLLIIPETRKLIIDAQVSQISMINFGWGVKMTKGPLAWYTEALRDSFGFWWVYIVILGACAWGFIFNGEKRLLNVLLLAWVAPLSLYLIFFVAYKNPRYLLPTLLPMMSCVGNLQAMNWNISRSGLKRLVTVGSAAVPLFLLGIQFVYNVRADAQSYLRTLDREQESPSLALYRQLDQIYFQQLPEDARLVVFRDPYVYLPPLKNIDVRMKWGSADYRDIDTINPDLIVLQKNYILSYSDPALMDISDNPEQAQKSLTFYRDAKNDTIQGYHRILDAPFGAAFQRDK